MTKKDDCDKFEKNYVKSVEKAMGIFLLFSKEEPELSHTEITRRMGWTNATASRLLNSLLRTDFLVKNEDNGKYRLGVAFVYLGKLATGSDSLEKVVLPVLTNINNIVGETVHIFVRDGIYRYCLYQIECKQLIKQSSIIGFKEPIWTGATGRVLLAFQKPAVTESIIAECRKQAPQFDFDSLLITLAEDRRRGYVVKDGRTDQMHHVGCVATPICDNNGVANMCLAVSYPDFRSPDDATDCVNLVQAGAAQIAENLKYYY